VRGLSATTEFLNWSRTTWAKRSWRSSRRCRSKCLWCSRPVRAIR